MWLRSVFGVILLVALVLALTATVGAGGHPGRIAAFEGRRFGRQ